MDEIILNVNEFTSKINEGKIKVLSDDEVTYNGFIYNFKTNMEEYSTKLKIKKKFLFFNTKEKNV